MARKTGRLAVRCGHSACGLVGELRRRNTSTIIAPDIAAKCEEPNTREEVVQEQFAAALHHPTRSHSANAQPERGSKADRGTKTAARVEIRCPL